MIDYDKKVEYLYNKQSGRCASCGRHLVVSDKKELAHKIKASKYNYKTYGEKVIDHRFNLALTHSGKCNDMVNMSRAAHPVETEALIFKIREDIIINT